MCFSPLYPWHQGVNVTNILREAFIRADPKSEKKTVGLTVFFSIGGPSRVKAARKMLVILTPTHVALAWRGIPVGTTILRY